MKNNLKTFLPLVEIITICIIVGLACVSIHSFISHSIAEDSILEANEFCYFIKIIDYRVDDELHTIYYDKNTGVMYCKIGLNQGGVTPIYNEDGTIRIYKGE